MTNTEIKQIAIDSVDGKIFGTWNIPEHDGHLIGSIFMCLLFADENIKTGWEERQIVHFYEYFDQSMPRCVNGYPIFGSCREISKKDFKLFIQYHEEYKKQKEEFLKDEDGSQ